MCPPVDLQTLDDSEYVDSSWDRIPTCVPADPLSKAAFTHVKQHLHPLILNHSLRVFLYMLALSKRENATWHDSEDLSLLFTAAMFHDFGSTEVCNGPERFEVEGAGMRVATSRNMMRSSQSSIVRT